MKSSKPVPPNKPRVVKDYEKLDESVIMEIKLKYPYGFQKNLVTFTNKDGKLVSALPYEAEDKYYLIRMTRQEAVDIIKEDSDYDDDGVLKEDIQKELTEKIEMDDDLDDIADDDDSDSFGEDDDDEDIDDD